MIEDKVRWNKKHQEAVMPQEPIAALKRAVTLLPKGAQVLDVACGTGRHAHFLALLGHRVDAVDYSDIALASLQSIPQIRAIEADLDYYDIALGCYDLIVCTNFLSRRLFQSIKDGLKPQGVVVFETFVAYDVQGAHQTSNPRFHLRPNELLQAFQTLEILFYEERIEKNLRDEWVKVATLVAQKTS